MEAFRSHYHFGLTQIRWICKAKVCQTSAIGAPSLIAPASREPLGGEVINCWMNWGLGGRLIWKLVEIGVHGWNGSMERYVWHLIRWWNDIYIYMHVVTNMGFFLVVTIWRALICFSFCIMMRHHIIHHGIPLSNKIQYAPIAVGTRVSNHCYLSYSYLYLVTGMNTGFALGCVTSGTLFGETSMISRYSLYSSIVAPSHHPQNQCLYVIDFPHFAG